MCAVHVTVGLNRPAVIGLAAFLIVAMFDQACAQEASQFKSPFVGVFKRVEKTCLVSESWPEWACCCPFQITFNSSQVQVNGTMVRAVPASLYKTEDLLKVNTSGFSSRLKVVYQSCNQQDKLLERIFPQVEGTTDKPLTLFHRNEALSTESVNFIFERRFQLSLDGNRLSWDMILSATAREQQQSTPDGPVDENHGPEHRACNYVRYPQTPSQSPSGHTVAPSGTSSDLTAAPTISSNKARSLKTPSRSPCGNTALAQAKASSPSSVLETPTLPTLTTAFALALLFQAAMVLA